MQNGACLVREGTLHSPCSCGETARVPCAPCELIYHKLLERMKSLRAASLSHMGTLYATSVPVGLALLPWAEMEDLPERVDRALELELGLNQSAAFHL